MSPILSGLRMCSSNGWSRSCGIHREASSFSLLMRARRSCCRASGDAGRNTVSSTVNCGWPSASLPSRPWTMAGASWPELSTITMREVCVAVWPTRNTTSKIEPAPISGTMTVPIMNPLVRTRVRYSRLMISRILRMSRPINENFAQRRLQKLETRDARVGSHRGFQNFLRIGAGLQLGFDSGDQPRGLPDGRVIQERIAAGEFHVQRVLAVGLLDGAQLAVEHVAALVNQADRIAQALHLLHAVRGKHDRGTLLAHIQHDFLNGGGVHGIQTGKRLVQNHQGRAVNHRGDELHFLLHAFREVHQLFVRPLGEAQAVEPFLAAAGGFSLRQAVQRGEEDDDLQDLHARVEAALLRQVTDLVARAVADQLTEHVDRA